MYTISCEELEGDEVVSMLTIPSETSGSSLLDNVFRKFSAVQLTKGQRGRYQKVPRVPKHYFRRDLVAMYTNVFNSNSYPLLKNYVQQCIRPDFRLSVGDIGQRWAIVTTTTMYSAMKKDFWSKIL